MGQNWDGRNGSVRKKALRSTREHAELARMLRRRRRSLVAHLNERIEKLGISVRPWSERGARFGSAPRSQPRHGAGKALQCWRMLDEEQHPIVARTAARTKEALSLARARTFDQCAAAYIKAHPGGWESAKHAAQWETSLGELRIAVFGALPVSEVDTGLVSTSQPTHFFIAFVGLPAFAGTAFFRLAGTSSSPGSNKSSVST